MRTKLLWVLGLVSLLGLLVSQADASVVSRWTFDEGTGTTVADSVGDNHGVFVGNPTWEDGVLGGALRVAGRGNEAAASFVSCGNDVVKGPDVSVGVWLKKDAVSNCQVIGQSNGNNSTEPGWFIFPRVNGWMWFVINGPEGNWEAGHLRLDDSQGLTEGVYQENEWVHIAFTFKDETKELTGYINGELIRSRIIDQSRNVINCPADMRIGRTANGSPNWNGVVDELVIYDHVLTPEEIPMLMEGLIVGIPQAAQPTPQDGALVEETVVQLKWLAGTSAQSHNVYIGTSAAAVERATEPTVANLTEASLLIGLPLPGVPFPNGLEYGTTYYWRVDEINQGHPDSPWVGEVWSFTVPFLEAYDPYPKDGMIQVLTNQQLSWSAGFGAETHTVYIGTDPNEVANADTGGKVVGETTYTPTEPLITGQTYYWRVDETTDVINKGTVWSFTTVPDYPVTDETLIGHWKLDGPNAALMADSSGHGLHAEIATPGGSVEGINGPVDGAIKLDGLSDIRTVVDVNSVAEMNTNTVTLTAWVRTDVLSVSRGWGILQETGRRVALQLGSGNNPILRWPGGNFGSSTLQLTPTRWAFVAAVVEPHQATLYLDGKDNAEVDPTPRNPVVFDRAMEIGTDGSGYNTRFIGALDDLRFYSRALTPDEIEQVMQLGTPPLEADTLTIDSFDGYRVWDYQTTPNVWDVWPSGLEGDPATNGSISGNLEEPYMHLANPAGGTGLALPLHYDNTVATLSEITRTFAPAQDLTREGATSLVIWVRGPIGEGIDPGDDVYVVLSDGTTDYYRELTTAEEVINLPEGTPVPWKKVTIALSDLTINPASLTSMTIGVGNRTNPQNGGLGTVFVDNIGLE